MKFPRIFCGVTLVTLSLFALFGILSNTFAEYNEKGEYVFPIEPWNDPNDPYVIAQRWI